MAEDKKATWGIRVNAESNAGEAANSVEALLKQILKSQEAVKSYGSSMSKLRGTSDEVKEASEKLKAAKEAERESISRATLALGKMGLTYGDAAKATKDAAAKAKASAVEQETAAKKAKEAAEKNTAAAEKEWAAWTSAAGIVATAVAAMVTAFAAAAISLAKFVVESANALRTMSLFREAATGSAENAKAFGHQIEALADKIPTSREELNKLAVEQSRLLVNTRLSGKGIVDTFNAVAQASSAMGDTAGKQIEGLITRSAQFGRLGIGINELQGTGVQFTDVAKQLSENLKIGINEAQFQLRYGRVKVDAGAKALRDVIEKRFGGINARRMLDLNVMATKFRDNLQRLTEDVNLEPILGGFAKLGKLFSQNTVTGQALKKLVTAFGDGIGKVFKFVTPLAEKFFKQIIIESLKLEIGIIRLGKWLDKTFGPDWSSKIDLGAAAIVAAKVAFWSLAGAIATTVAIGAAFLVGIAGIIKYFENIGEKFHSIGLDIMTGIEQGFIAGRTSLLAGILTTADAVKNAFKNALGIHSPSTVFADFGRMTGKGYEQGVDESSHGATQSVEKLIALPGGAGAKGSGGASAGASAKVDVSLVFPNVHDGAGVQKTIAGPEFKAALTKAFEEILRGAGVPTQGAT